MKNIYLIILKICTKILLDLRSQQQIKIEKLNMIYGNCGKISTKKIFLKIYEKLLKILLIMQFIQIMKRIFLKEIMMYILVRKHKILKIILKIFWCIGKNLKFLSSNILHQNQFLRLGKQFGKTKI